MTDRNWIPKDATHFTVTEGQNRYTVEVKFFPLLPNCEYSGGAYPIEAWDTVFGTRDVLTQIASAPKPRPKTLRQGLVAARDTFQRAIDTIDEWA